MKRYRLTYNVGKVKYLISYHNGIKKHNDGSDFFDIACFRNKEKMNDFRKELLNSAYINMYDLSISE